MTPKRPPENPPETSPRGSTPHGRDAGDTAPAVPSLGADGPTTADLTVVLFHHVQGLTPGVLAFAERLREGGHRVVTPDLFEVFEYPGDRHLFTDSSLPSHDAAATEEVLARSLESLNAPR